MIKKMSSYFSFHQATGKKSFAIYKVVLLVLIVSLALPISVFAAPPVFTQTGPFSVSENSSAGSIVGSVAATGATSYAITAGNGTGGGAFTIDNGGVIRVLDGTQLDYEVTPQFTLTVTATNTDGTTQASVTINVQNVNDPPQMDQGFYTFSINENLPDGSLVGAVSATDNDPGDTIIYGILPGPVTAFAIDSDDGEIRIVDTSQINFEAGPTMYTIYVQASDGGLNDIVPVMITITDANDAPVAVDDGPYDATEDVDLVVNLVASGVLANDTDEDPTDAGNLTAVLETDATHGTVALNPDGTFTYDPDPQYDGPDSFTYRASDGTDQSNIATVTIDVVGTNDAPVITEGVSVAVNIDEDENPVAFALTLNATDPEGNTLTWSILTPATNGTASASGTGASQIIEYDPDPDYNGTDSFVVRVSDGNGGTDDITVNVNIASQNDDPTANDDSFTVAEDSGTTPLDVLANDSMLPDSGETLSITAVGATDNGGTAVQNGSNIDYTPALDFFGTEVFTYTMGDGNGAFDTATITVTVTAVNDDPTANDDSFTVAEDSGTTPLDVLVNDSTAPDSGETLSITAVGPTNNGGTAVQNGSSIDYTPAADFFGTEVFTYTIGDGNGGVDTATVTVTVTSVNDAPVITDGTSVTVDMDEDSNPTPFSLTLNATDIEDADSTLIWSIASQGGHGTASASTPGASSTINYTPNANYNGTDSFVVQVADGNGGTDTITVNVNIAPQNDDPTANDDSYIVDEQSSGNVLNVLANDSILPDSGETLSITAVGTPDNGGTAINNGTNIAYTPDPAFIGTEMFTYTISDGNGGTDTATVTVTVQDVNFPPVITEGTSVLVNMDEDSTPTAFSLTLNATDPDGNTLTWSIFAQGANGTASASGTGGSKVIGYTPNPNFNGVDSFVVRVSDGNGGTDDITVNVNIAAQNDDPTANDDSFTVNEQSSNNTLNVLANDLIAPDNGETLAITAVGTPDNGGTAVNNGTNITYTPDLAFIGTETFTYTISDGNGGTDTATVTVIVQDVNFPPVITEGISVGVTMSEDGVPTPFALTLNATDPDGNTLTWSISSPVAHGTASASGTGNSKAINYAPNANYNGTDSFVVQVSDGNGGTDTITVNVTITPQNDAPTAVNDSATTPQNTAVLIYVLSNDDDIDGDTLSVSGVTNGSNGTVINHGTHVEYTPDAAFEGDDTFTYTASDGNGGTSVATVSVNVGKTYVYLPMIIKPGVQAPDLVVQSVTATSDVVEVVIRNQGTVATSTGFWVDFYVNPSVAPTHANQLWDDLAAEGIAWGVTDPIAAGAELTLTYSTDPNAPNLYYSAAESNFSGTLAAGTPVYAQVDSAHLGNVNGAILETHEISGDAYNNISDEVLATGAATTSLNINSLLSLLSSVAAKFGLPSR